MDQIKRKMGDGWHTYTIYTEAEALEKGLTIVPWRKATPGDWALSDDGYVGECIRVWHTKNNTRFITLTYGEDWDPSKLSMLYEERAATKNWSYRCLTERHKKEARRTRSRNAISAYVTMLLSGQKIDWAALGQMFRPDNVSPIFHVRREFKKRAFKEMIQQELERVLLNRGSSPRRVIEMYNEAFDKAADKDKPSVMVDVADRFSDLWGLKDTMTPNGEIPVGLGDVTILEGVEADLLKAKETDGQRD